LKKTDEWISLFILIAKEYTHLSKSVHVSFETQDIHLPSHHKHKDILELDEGETQEREYKGKG
jgi:hypothetical protein